VARFNDNNKTAHTARAGINVTHVEKPGNREESGRKAPAQLSTFARQRATKIKA